MNPLIVEGIAFRAIGLSGKPENDIREVAPYLEAHTLPLFWGAYLKITDPNHKTRYPKKGVGYEPLGRVWVANEW